MSHRPDEPFGVVRHTLAQVRQLVSRQRHRPRTLAAWLLEAGEHMFAFGTNAVARLVARIQPHAPLLLRLRIPRNAVPKPACLQQIPVGQRVVARVGQHLRAGVGSVQRILERLAVVGVGRRDPLLADQLVARVSVGVLQPLGVPAIGSAVFVARLILLRLGDPCLRHAGIRDLPADGMYPCCCSCMPIASKMARPPRPPWAKRSLKLHSVRASGMCSATFRRHKYGKLVH